MLQCLIQMIFGMRRPRQSGSKYSKKSTHRHTRDLPLSRTSSWVSSTATYLGRSFRLPSFVCFCILSRPKYASCANSLLAYLMVVITPKHPVRYRRQQPWLVWRRFLPYCSIGIPSANKSFAGNKGTCWTTCANLIIYHLISLNAITSFKDIEQFARREVALGSFRYASWLQMRCIDQPEEAFFHCGQILRLIRSMPRPVRPPWWAGAVYRVALTGWATSMASGNGRFSPTHAPAEPDRPFCHRRSDTRERRHHQVYEIPGRHTNAQSA